MPRPAHVSRVMGQDEARNQEPNDAERDEGTEAEEGQAERQGGSRTGQGRAEGWQGAEGCGRREGGHQAAEGEKAAKRGSKKGGKKGGKKEPKKRSKFTAETSDRYDLYQRSVNSPEADVDFLFKVYERLRDGKRPRHLREDFCGTANLAAEWLRRGDDLTAEGFDLDPSPSSGGKRVNFTEVEAR
jgi:hypothetical protein